jgi:hypothetical protein
MSKSPGGVAGYNICEEEYPAHDVDRRWREQRLQSPRISLLGALRELYAREINVLIESDWDNGFTVAIGNQRNRFAAQKHFAVEELDHAAGWLQETVSPELQSRPEAGLGPRRPDIPRILPSDGIALGA